MVQVRAAAKDYTLIRSATRPQWLKNAGLFGLVAALHLAVFAWIGLRTPLSQMRPLDAEAVEVFLYRPPPPPRPRENTGRAIASAPVPYRPRMAARASQAVESIPAPPAAPPPTAPQKPVAPLLPAPLTSLGGALRGSPVGCANRARLTGAERDACDDKLSQAGGGKMLPLGIDPRKMAEYDAVVAAKSQAIRDREGSMRQLIVPCRGAGSNLGMACNPGEADRP